MATLDEIRDLTTQIKVRLPQERQAVMARARAEGITWAAIAEAAGMTTMGARKVVEGDGPRNPVALKALGQEPIES